MQSSNLFRQVLRKANGFRHSTNNILNNNTTTRSTPAVGSAAFSSWLDKIAGGMSNNSDTNPPTMTTGASSSAAAADDVKVEKVRVAACGDIDSDDEDEMEQEEMFVEAYASPSFDHGAAEWGGPRRGGRLPEPTRFGDWERKGRCSDF